MSTGSPAFHVSSGRPPDGASPRLAVPVFEDDPIPVTRPDGELEAEIARARASGGFTGKRFETLVVAPGNGAAPARTIVLLGAGPSAEFSREICRRLGATAAMLARARCWGGLAVVHRGLETGGTPSWVEAWAEGLTLGEFDPGRYKTEGRGEEHRDATIVVPGATVEEQSLAAAAADRARLVAGCVNLARELVNEPANLLPPRVLAARARAAAEGTTLRVDVLDPSRIAELGMGLVMGVAQGSQEPACVIVIEHRPPNAPARPVLGLVGKGVTFDSGGISIKPALNMERMKDDMAGGAAVVAALRAIALLNVPLHVVGVIPSVENMPSGSAIRPGDVLRAASGRTVEVIDTDAEGRLILGDALWYAQRLGATHLVDVATLTGACAVALGKTTTGVFGRPDAWVEAIRGLANEAGDRCWALPVCDDYRDVRKSESADSLNVGGRYGGAITAALFVGDFAGALPWAHLDIAGTAWNDEAKPYAPKGPTGVGVRALTALAEAMSRGLAGA
jgi:leucyl aminopeptidase